MRIAPPILLALAAILAGGCRSDTPSGPTLELPLARAMPTCGSTDGQAVQVELAAAIDDQPVPPLAWVTIDHARSELAGRSFVIGRDGWASLRHTSEGGQTHATDGLVTVHRVAANGTVDGQLSLRFYDGTRMVQRFSAPWIERTTGCF